MKRRPPDILTSRILNHIEQHFAHLVEHSKPQLTLFIGCSTKLNLGDYNRGAMGSSLGILRLPDLLLVF